MTLHDALARIVSYGFGLFLMTASTARSTIRMEAGQLGNLFLTNETTQIPLTCDGNEIRWTVTDYFGAIIETGNAVPKNRYVLIQPSLSTVGYFDLKLTELTNGTETSTLITSFGIITPIDTSAMAESPFGVHTHFAQSHDQSVIALLKKAGIMHIRDEQYWGSIENPKGIFNYPAKFTNYMASATTSGIEPFIPLTFGNQFYDYEAGVYTAPHSDSGRAGYANYALNVLQKYPQVKAVEVWNEYNAGTFIKGPAVSNKPLYYKLMLQKVHETVKSGHPGVKIVAGATVPVAHGFFQQLFAQGAMPYLDVVSVHYPHDVEIEISGLRDLIKGANGGQDKPIWVTEFSAGPSNEAEQYAAASYLAQAATLMLSQNVERMYYYLVMDDNSFPLRGLVGSSSNPRGKFRPHPTLIAYANLIRQYDGATYQGRFNTSPSVYAFKFQRGSTQLSALWSHRPVVVDIGASGPVTVFGIMGNSYEETPVNGKISLDLTKDVQYVVGPVTSLAEIDNDLLADSVSDYSKTAGTNGWHYGYATLASTASYDPAQFKPMTWGIWGSDNYRWLAPGRYPFASGSNMHPSRSWAIRRWVSNFAGSVSVSGVLSRGSGGDGVNIRIFVDGIEVYNRYLSPNQSITYNLPNVALKVGSKLDFTVNQAGENNFDATLFTSAIVRQSSGACSP